MNLGKIKYSSHSNKTRSVFVDNKESPLICIDIWCKAGSSFDDIDKNGTAHFLEHMIFKGTNNIKPGEFDNKIETLGGLSNASTGYDDSHYYVVIPHNNFKESLALLTNLVFFPKIDIEEFDLEKSVIIEEIKQQNDQPDEKLFNYFLSRVWLDHQYGKAILGTEESINSLDKYDLEKFHSNYYHKDNICYAIAGNLSNDIYKIFDDSQFKYFNNQNETHLKISNSNAVTRVGREEKTFKNIELSRIFISWRIPSLKNSKIILGFEILASILSEGRNSRLVRSLKEENNLVESVFVELQVGELGSLLVVEACCVKNQLKNVEDKINQIINDLLDHKNLSINELIKAINIVKSNYVFNLETSSQLTSFFGNDLLWERKNSFENFDKNLEYWRDLNNFKEIIKYLSNKKKYTFVAIEE